MRIKINDKLSTHERLYGGLHGRVMFGMGRKLIPIPGTNTFATTFEEILFDDTNIITIGAYQYTFNHLFNIGLDQESTLRVGDLNDDAPQMKIGVPRSEYQSSHYDALVSSSGGFPMKTGINISPFNYIFGFMVGCGGAAKDNITALSPDYKRRDLYKAIPFRMVTDNDNDVDRTMYFGRQSTYQESNSIFPVTSYYVKKFSDPAPHIVHRWKTDNEKDLQIVDDTVFSSTSSNAIESYVEVNLSIDAKDCREYFETTNDSPRINEFGLVSGEYNLDKQDYESIRLFSHFVRPSINLTENDEIYAVYRIYSR